MAHNGNLTNTADLLALLQERYPNQGTSEITGGNTTDTAVLTALTAANRDSPPLSSGARAMLAITVVRATRAGLKLVATLSQTIEAHYAWMEERLGKARLAQLYTLLDSVIALEVPDADEGGGAGWTEEDAA